MGDGINKTVERRTREPDGVTATVLREPAVIQAYLGEDAAAGPAASLKTDLAPA